MKWAFGSLVTLACVVCTSWVLAEDSLETAKQLVEFWQPLEGSWEVTVEVDGTDAADKAGTFVWTFTRSPTGLCYLDEIRVDGKVTEHAIHGYDPEHKHWFFVSYGLPQQTDRRLHGTTWLLVSPAKNERLTRGVSFIAEGKDVMLDGSVVKIRNRWEFTEVQSDKVVVRFSDVTHNGDPKPNTTMTLRKRRR